MNIHDINVIYKSRNLITKKRSGVGDKYSPQAKAEHLKATRGMKGHEKIEYALNNYLAKNAIAQFEREVRECG